MMKIAIAIAVMAAAVLLFALSLYVLAKGARMIDESKLREQDLEVVQRGLHKKEMALDLWEKQLYGGSIDFASSKKVWANYVVEPGEYDEHRVYKALSIKLGYAVMKFYGDRMRVTEKGDGRTVYSMEINVLPYNVEKKS